MDRSGQAAALDELDGDAASPGGLEEDGVVGVVAVPDHQEAGAERVEQRFAPQSPPAGALAGEPVVDVADVFEPEPFPVGDLVLERLGPAERQLEILPRAWSGLGLYANYTYVDSSSTQRLTVATSVDPAGFVEFDDVPFEGSPEHQGTFGLTYTKYGLDASLLYTAQSRRLDALASFGLDNYEESLDTLDFQARYWFDVSGHEVALTVRAEDLLSDEEDPFLQTSLGGERGVPTYYSGGTYFGGRSFFLGLSTAF